MPTRQQVRENIILNEDSYNNLWSSIETPRERFSATKELREIRDNYIEWLRLDCVGQFSAQMSFIIKNILFAAALVILAVFHLCAFHFCATATGATAVYMRAGCRGHQHQHEPQRHSSHPLKLRICQMDPIDYQIPLQRHSASPEAGK